LLRLADVRRTAIHEAPPGYRLVTTGKLDLDQDRGRLGFLSLVALLVAVPLFILATGPLGGPFDPLAGRPLRVQANPLDLLGVLLTALIVLPVVHELTHGLVAAMVGARPVYGIVPPVAAFCHFERFVTRPQYALILAAPLVVISVAGVALMPVIPAWLKGQVLVLLTLNASGAVGDLWMLNVLRTVPANALIADTAVGFEAYLPAEQP
jgi:hypothetical protein